MYSKAVYFYIEKYKIYTTQKRIKDKRKALN